jgi:hypothetical protein
MTIYVDIDGTICTQTKSDYKNAQPIPENIAKINELFHQGNCIVYWTVRGRSSGIDWYAFTYDQLTSWGCKFHSLDVKTKPRFDLLIDDRTKRIEEL